MHENSKGAVRLGLNLLLPLLHESHGADDLSKTNEISSCEGDGGGTHEGRFRLGDGTFGEHQGEHLHRLPQSHLVRQDPSPLLSLLARLEPVETFDLVREELLDAESFGEVLPPGISLAPPETKTEKERTPVVSTLLISTVEPSSSFSAASCPSAPRSSPTRTFAMAFRTASSSSAASTPSAPALPPTRAHAPKAGGGTGRLYAGFTGTPIGTPIRWCSAFMLSIALCLAVMPNEAALLTKGGGALATRSAARRGTAICGRGAKIGAMGLGRGFSMTRIEEEEEAAEGDEAVEEPVRSMLADLVDGLGGGRGAPGTLGLSSRAVSQSSTRSIFRVASLWKRRRERETRRRGAPSPPR